MAQRAQTEVAVLARLIFATAFAIQEESSILSAALCHDEEDAFTVS